MDMDCGFTYTRRMLSLCERLCEQIRETECDYNSFVSGLASLAFLLLTTKIFRFRMEQIILELAPSNCKVRHNQC